MSIEDLYYPDALLAEILGTLRRVALLGASADPARSSHEVMAFLLERGVEVVPVNPRLAGQAILGRAVVASLAQVPGPIGMIDVFRGVDALDEVADEVLALAESPPVVWMQLGVWSPAPVARLEARGITVVANRCPKIEWKRLGAIAAV